MDPKLDDTEKIMLRYANKDAIKKAEQEKMRLGNDPRGGIDNIAASQVNHRKTQDDTKIRETFDSFSTGAKGSDGTPNGERHVEKWNAKRASEEVIRLWTAVSDGAVEKFLADNFDSTWSDFDPNSTGAIDESQYVSFMR